MMCVLVWYLAFWLVCLCLVLCVMMTSAISCPLWLSQCTSAREWSVRLHIRWGLSLVYLWCAVCSGICMCPHFVVGGCAVSRRYIDVCYCDMFSVVNVYLDHLKFCVVCINGRRYVCCGECYVISNECDESTSCLVATYRCALVWSYVLWVFDFRGELGFLNCDDICMCVVNKQFELMEFVCGSVYVDLQYDETSLTFTAGYVCLCCVCSHVVVFGLSVRLSWNPMWMRWFLWLWYVYCCFGCM